LTMSHSNAMAAVGPVALSQDGIWLCPTDLADHEFMKLPMLSCPVLSVAVLGCAAQHIGCHCMPKAHPKTLPRFGCCIADVHADTHGVMGTVTVAVTVTVTDTHSLSRPIGMLCPHDIAPQHASAFRQPLTESALWKANYQHWLSTQQQFRRPAVARALDRIHTMPSTDAYITYRTR